jgi:hypothetical protein
MIAAACAAVVACGRSGEAPRAANPLLAPPVDAAIARAAAAGWAHRSQVQADLDGDGSAETIVLTADVTLDARGRPLWEDGHRWAVFVRHAGTAAPTFLYAAFVPNGTVEAATGAPGSDGKAGVVILERQPSRVRVAEVGYAAGAGATLKSDGYYHVEKWAPAL